MSEIRNTRQKQLILSMLNEADGPLTAGEVYTRALKVQPKIAKSTVYRILEGMLDRGEVTHGMLESGESFYGAVQGHAHKHYMICKGCNRMLDLPECPLGNLERDIEDSCGFSVTDHVIQIYGYCKDCKKRKDGKESGDPNK